VPVVSVALVAVAVVNVAEVVVTDVIEVAVLVAVVVVEEMVVVVLVDSQSIKFPLMKASIISLRAATTVGHADFCTTKYVSMTSAPSGSKSSHSKAWFSWQP
jgi:hypothetical protein